MDIALLAPLVIAAFFLGACPFSLWIGRALLHKDIRQYGDANPGAWNVIRAGGLKIGLLALFLDIIKGIPFVFIASLLFKFSLPAVMVVGLSAILGHAFSPFLRFRGGKAVAVTYGVLVALPQREMLLLMVVFMVIGVLLIERHSWVVMLGPIGSLVYFILTGATSAELFFLSGILLVFTIKHFPGLKTNPGYKGMLMQWLQAARR